MEEALRKVPIQKVGRFIDDDHIHNIPNVQSDHMLASAWELWNR